MYQTSHDEGRIVNGIYEYNINDHLGNLRVAFKDSSGIAKVTQVNAYGAWYAPFNEKDEGRKIDPSEDSKYINKMVMKDFILIKTNGIVVKSMIYIEIKITKPS